MAAREMRFSLTAVLVVSGMGGSGRCGEPSPQVTTLRVPGGGIQPQVVVDRGGTVHLVYYRGEPGMGDLFYVRSESGGKTFSTPLQVNSQRGSAVAAGTIRGAQLAVGRKRHVHVVWNGSGKARPRGLPNPQIPQDSPHRHSAPMLYTRLNATGAAFEPERNLMTRTYALDGGGSVAADDAENVYVVWHANEAGGPQGEGGRAVWVARSENDGETFAAEVRANDEPTGACSCCSLRAFADRQGALYVLYRSATRVLHRDMHVLTSGDHGKSFTASRIHEWRVPQCVMSSAAFCESSEGKLLGAWETQGQVYLSRIQGQPVKVAPVRATGDGKGRKHPVLAANARGEVILAWTEGTGWNRGGSVVWQVFDPNLRPLPGAAGRRDGVPVWSLVAVFARPGGGFTVVY